VVTRPANGTDIVRAAMAFRIADLHYQAMDKARTEHRGLFYDDDAIDNAQQAYNDARAALMALCDTRLRAYDPR
jgi:hypothetical protein